MTLGQLIETGGASVVAIVVVVAVGLLLGTLLARRLGVRPPLSALITVGMAICGNSAILALSPIVRAPHRETAYAVSTITIFGLVGVLLLPILGAALGLSDAVFGTWAGLAVNDTAQVVATGYAFSPAAGDVATVVKLTRNLAILPVLLGATWLAVRAAPRREGASADGVAAGSSIRLVARAVPWFVIGFVVFAGLRTAGLLDVALPTGGTLADLCSTVAACSSSWRWPASGSRPTCGRCSGSAPAVPPRGRDVGRHGPARAGALDGRGRVRGDRRERAGGAGRPAAVYHGG